MLTRLTTLARRLRRELSVYQLIVKHPRTPRPAKWLLGAAVAYALLPFDLIPDWIPVLGQLDDLVIVPLLLAIALRLVPKEIIAQCRLSARPEPDDGS